MGLLGFVPKFARTALLELAASPEIRAFGGGGVALDGGQGCAGTVQKRGGDAGVRVAGLRGFAGELVEEVGFDAAGAAIGDEPGPSANTRCL